MKLRLFSIIFFAVICVTYVSSVLSMDNPGDNIDFTETKENHPETGDQVAIGLPKEPTDQLVELTKKIRSALLTHTPQQLFDALNKTWLSLPEIYQQFQIQKKYQKMSAFRDPKGRMLMSSPAVNINGDDEDFFAMPKPISLIAATPAGSPVPPIAEEIFNLDSFYSYDYRDDNDTAVIPAMSPDFSSSTSLASTPSASPSSTAPAGHAPEEVSVAQLRASPPALTAMPAGTTLVTPVATSPQRKRVRTDVAYGEDDKKKAVSEKDNKSKRRKKQTSTHTLEKRDIKFRVICKQCAAIFDFDRDRKIITEDIISRNADFTWERFKCSDIAGHTCIVWQKCMNKKCRKQHMVPEEHVKAVKDNKSWTCKDNSWNPAEAYCGKKSDKKKSWVRDNT